jgi:hypothetical protein
MLGARKLLVAAAGVAAIVLSVAAWVLYSHASVAYDRRDAFAARVAEGKTHLGAATLVAEWRAEIAAERAIARRDLAMSRVLLATTVLLVAGLVVSSRASGRSGQKEAPGT